MFEEYIRHGWKLCRIAAGQKGPRALGWNEKKNALRSAADIIGAGLLHAYSGTCSVDVDRYDDAEKFLQQHGIDLSVLFSAHDAVQINSGRANRGKLLYALETPLQSKSLANGALELRCGTSTQRSAQDVLPPSMHPDTGKPYQWIGDWRHLPPLPESLRKFWMETISPSQTVIHTTSVPTAQLGELRDLLTRRSPDCGYDEWLRVGMALNHESGGNNEGFALWDEWSNSSDKYPGVAVLQAHWLSFGRSATPVTVDSIRKTDVASVEEFDVLETDWIDPEKTDISGMPKSAPEFRFLSLPELFDRPAPSWIIPSILPDAGLGSFWGQPGGGKTFLAVDIALSVALGQSWRGEAVRQGSVLYIAAEDDQGVQTRFQSGLASRGFRDAPIRVLPAAPVFTSPKQTDALLASVRASGSQSLVFVDTLAAVTPGSDENSAKDMSQVIHFCQKIHRITGGLVLLVHHDGKTAGRGPRGWSGLHGAFDVEWEVTDQETHREMRVAKMKNAPTGNIYPFKLLPMGESCIVEWTI